jgi:DNA-binding CsgD family transcriptional regulator/tetratricopeptide (TPR) repeat protein
MPERGASALPLFVGRAEELGAVHAVVERAARGDSSALMVSGDAGIGKSTLVQQALLTPPPGVVVLSGGGLPLGSMSVPFLALRAALRGLPPDLPAPPALDSTAVAAGAPVVFDQWLDGACALRPVALVVDDLHWCDQSTLDVLMYLLAGPRGRRFALLATLRRGEVAEGHPLHGWLADVRRMPGFEELVLGPLDRHETGQQIAGILGRPPHETLVGEVFTRTLGNSYLTRLLVTRLDPDAQHLPPALPADLRGALAANWHRASARAREVIKILAVGGRRMSSDELAKVMAGETPAADVVPLLHEALDLGVLDVDDVGGYWFHHPLQAEVIENQLPADERRRWHARFAAHLEGEIGHDGAAELERLAGLADHHYRADHPRPAYDWSLRAAEAAGAVGGATEQIRLLRRALSLQGQLTGARESRLALVRRLREAAAEVGDHLRELEAVEELLTLTDPESEPDVVGELLIRRMHLRFSLGQAFISREDTDHAAEVASAAPDSWQYALAVAEQSHAALWADDGKAQATLAQRAIDLAERAGHPRALSYACTAKSMVALVQRDDAAYGWADRARRAALEARDFWAYVHAVLWECNAIDAPFVEETRRHARTRRLEAEAVGCPHPYLSWIGQVEALGALASGQWEIAAERVRSALGSAPGALVDTTCRLTAARLAALQGRLPEALAHLERADELFADLSGFKAFEFDAVRADVLHAAGDPEGAYASAMNGLDLEGAAPTMCEWLVPMAARACADLAERARGDDSASSEALTRLAVLESRFPPVRIDLQVGGVPEPPQPLLLDNGFLTEGYLKRVAGLADWYVAECGRARRSPQNAEQWALAVAGLTDGGLPWEAAYAGYRLAQAHLRHGHGSRTPAAGALREAAAVARRLEAVLLLERIDELARSARILLDDVVVMPRGGAVLPGLTPREREILTHVVAGRTYGEIAAALVLSEKTVSSHISNMLRKTGAANRIELAHFARGA